MDEQDLHPAIDGAVNDAAGAGGAGGALDGHGARYARRARGSPNGSAGRRAGRRVARPTAGNRNRLVCERSAPTVDVIGVDLRGRW